MKERLLQIYMLVIGTLVTLCLFILLCIFVTELDVKNMEKQEEYQKLEYYKTLNKIYGGEID